MGWEVLKDAGSDVDLLSGNLAIHAALVETADGPAIFYFDGIFGQPGWRLFRISDRTVHPPPDEPGYTAPGHHVMCSGHAFLADGRLLIAGGVVGQNIGHEGPLHDSGERRCYTFNPLAATWEQVEDLNFQPGSEDDPRGGGRWYPTLLTLASGEVFAVSGHPYIGYFNEDDEPVTTGADDYLFPGDLVRRHNNNTPERYRPSVDDWVQLVWESTSHDNQGIDEYARVHLAPNGRVFFSTRAKDDKRFYSAYTGGYTDEGEVAPGDSAYHRLSETTSVMLPILMSDLDNVWVMTCGDVLPQRINIAAGSPQWESAGDRKQWADPGAASDDAVSPVRDHGNSVILPTGDIFVTGGVGPAGGATPQGASVRRPEVYRPPIDWGEGKYTTAGDGAWDTLDEAATVVRGYHGVALLMPDGAVFTAGSTDPAGGDSTPEIDENGDEYFANENEYRIEIFEPWYFDAPHQAARPTVSNVPKNIGYGYTFRFDTPQADAIDRVVLLRCGSTTHALDTDQRMVSVEFSNVDDTTLEVTVPYMPEYLPPGRYMLWVVDTAGRPSKSAPLIRISAQKTLFSVEFDKFAKSEVDAMAKPAGFDAALHLVYDGFLPGEVTSPTRTVVWADTGEEVPGIHTTLGPTKYEAGAAAVDVAQRIAVPVNVIFDDDTAFDEVPESPGFREIELRAELGPFTTVVTLGLTRKLNPRMSDGEPPWFSTDVRAFSTRAGAEPFTAGIANPTGVGGAYDYIEQLLVAYDAWPVEHPGEPHPFDSLPTVQETSHLPLYPDVDGDALFNFAIARVRFRALEGIQTHNVRVFFRLWTTGWTEMSYSTSTEFGSYPRDGNGDAATPRLGLLSDEVNTIPCFATPRASVMTDQVDPPNLKPLSGIGQDEAYGYFGCLVDSNHGSPLFPLEPDPDDPGPYSGELKTIRQIMRGLHQCLVAEIHYWPEDEIPAFATPVSSDNLSQRNLIFDEAPNPGGFGSHLVHHTFELKASPVQTSGPAGGSEAGAAARRRLHPDELVIDFGNLPRDSHVVLFMPQVDVDEVLRLAAERQGPPLLSRAGDHAIRCKVTDMCFVPIPKTAAPTIAGLATVQLPPNLTKGQRFSIVLRQVDGRKLRVIGTTQFDILIKTESEILPRLTRNLGVLKHIALSIPESNRWVPVFERYIGEMGDRVRALGGDPDAVPALPGGDRPRPEAGGERGKVRDLVYDCFGDFEGFVLETCEGRFFYRSCDRGLEEVARRACRDGSPVTVRPSPEDRRRPLRVIVHCC